MGGVATTNFNMLLCTLKFTCTPILIQFQCLFKTMTLFCPMAYGLYHEMRPQHLYEQTVQLQLRTHRQHFMFISDLGSNRERFTPVVLHAPTQLVVAAVCLVVKLSGAVVDLCTDVGIVVLQTPVHYKTGGERVVPPQMAQFQALTFTDMHLFIRLLLYC